MAFDLNNMSKAYQRFATSCSAAAYAIALGSDAITDRAVAFAVLCETDPTLEPLDLSGITRDVYVERIRIPAEVMADKANKPLKPQTDKSRNSQVSKMAAYGKLGFRARENGAVIPALRFAVEKCASGYTATTKCVVALVAELAKNPALNKAELEAVVTKNLPAEKEKTALGVVEKLEKALAKARDGSEEEPGILAPHMDDTAKRGAYDKALAGLTELRTLLAREQDPLA